MDATFERYSRQILFGPIGEAGQRMLHHSRVALIGCGALGSVLAETLVRAGVGFVRIVDRDFIELSNLQRQVLFDEHDVAANLPKAEAAARKLRRINSSVEVEPVVADFNPSNAESLCEHADLILDGTDNFEARFLINDVAVKLEVPWVYGACVAAEGLVMPILPRRTPCLRCVWEEAPPPGTTPTCDTAGVLGPLVNIVASFQAVEAIKILVGRLDDLNRRLVTIDAWTGRVHAVDMQPARDAGDCPCCKLKRYEYLSGERSATTTALCGRDAVQVMPAAAGGEPTKIDLKRIASRLPAHMRPAHNAFLLRFTINELRVTLFADGRAIVQGTQDPAAARAVVAKYVGS